ncbi:hypothetical protein ARNL5_01802 [Anaerolineae bacterium]|nr:hypothetical protein ARNL5_01802 [Anaerolineae bacterium]
MDEVGQVMRDAGVYVINGGLSVSYFLFDHLALLIAIACAAIVICLFDRWLIDLATSTPARQGRAAPRRAVSRPYARTVITLGMWLIAASLYPAPVPELGAAMWLAAVVAVLLLPTERASVLGACKNLILTYALMLLGFLWYVNTTAQASAREWAAIIGGVGEAQQTLAQNQNLIMTIGTIGITWSGPVAAAIYLWGRLKTHLDSLAAPWQSMAEIVRDIRTRA